LSEHGEAGKCENWRKSCRIECSDSARIGSTYLREVFMPRY
jgi:hypothetical protein